MIKLNFLFSSNLDLERLELISNLIANLDFDRRYAEEPCQINIHLTGDSLYSLKDGRMHKLWVTLLTYPHLKVYIDHSELQMFGLSVDFLLELYSNKIFLIHENYMNILNFWEVLIDNIYNKILDSRIGFLQNSGPYMDRTSVYALRLVNAAINRDLNPEYYGYLDGVHLGHKGQNPSEFENIGSSLIDIKQRAYENNLCFSMLSCSRCGIARGYIRSQSVNELYESDDTIPSYYFCNLNKIVDQFEKNHPILSSNSAIITYDLQENYSKPELILFVTHSPYGTEWTFGAISFAVGCASHNIPTHVIFIENGVYCLIGEHNINENDKIFNLQDIMESTLDMEFLKFYAYEPSLKKRSLLLSEHLKSVSLVNDEELTNTVLKNNRKGLYHKRIIFF